MRDMAAEAAESAARTLAEVVPRLGRLIASALEADAGVALSLRQYRVLQRLVERPHRTGELATSSQVTQPTASSAVASLEARGLVTRQPDPADRRATLIVLTDAGRAMFDLATERILERLMIVTRGMSADQVEALEGLKPTLVEGMDRARRELRLARDAPA